MKFDEDSIVFLILLFSWGEYLWELYLSLRQVIMSCYLGMPRMYSLLLSNSFIDSIIIYITAMVMK